MQKSHGIETMTCKEEESNCFIDVMVRMNVRPLINIPYEYQAANIEVR